ncbi:MAG TPA: DUF4331 domain-containing protein [Steroidobacteraceae bacterium]|nr:DUF4331 domain-containing protein [Steroidobacteraceae bacterium]
MNANISSRSALLTATAVLLPLCAVASSHREAPSIAGSPRVDGTDFYMFRSYEPGRSAYVTLIANYIPLQDPYGGPNYFNLDPEAVYKIHIDNDGDADSDLTFEFKFKTIVKDFTVNANGVKTAIPLVLAGPIDATGANLNVQQSYTITLTTHGKRERVHNATLGGDVFFKPADNIGNKTFSDYADYAGQFLYEVSIPGCGASGRVFVGQRKDGFVVNLGEVFDLVNTNPVGPRDGEPNTISDKNVTSLALEVPIGCLTNGKDPVIGGWTTASLPVGDDWRQVSRLGMPLVNELVIGLPDKDKFNASRPVNDGQFLHYVTNPYLPVLLNAEFGTAAVIPASPRNDLVAAFLTGVKGLNQPLKVTPGEMLRLNTSILPTPPATQNDLGVLGGDLAGFPNGRRPYDDVVDITLRVAEGALCGAIGNCGAEISDPNNGLPYTDGARAAGPDVAHEHVTGEIKAGDTYLPVFPYLNTPLPGSPNGLNGVVK